MPDYTNERATFDERVLQHRLASGGRAQAPSGFGWTMWLGGAWLMGHACWGSKNIFNKIWKVGTSHLPVILRTPPASRTVELQT